MLTYVGAELARKELQELEVREEQRAEGPLRSENRQFVSQEPR